MVKFFCRNIKKKILRLTLLCNSLFKRYPIVATMLITFTAVTTIFYCEFIFGILHPLFKVSGNPASVKHDDYYPVSENFEYCASAEERKLKKYVHFMSTEANALKAVITILANKPHAQLLRRSLNQLYANFNRQFGYPVIIFHEEDFLPYLPALRDIGFNPRFNRSSIFFRQVNMCIPSWHLEKFGPPPKVVCGSKNGYGYRSMCRFQAKTIYEEPIMKHFDYQWRLDDDSEIDKKISFDVFAALRDTGCSYGYFESMIDECGHDTYNVTIDYMRMRHIRPTFFYRLKLREVFFNNFEVSSLKIWRSSRYQDYVKYIDSLGGIYLHRWGDAPIKTLALSMFVPVAEICQFTNISYKHPGLNSTFKTHFLQ